MLGPKNPSSRWVIEPKYSMKAISIQVYNSAIIFKEISAIAFQSSKCNRMIAFIWMLWPNDGYWTWCPNGFCGGHVDNEFQIVLHVNKVLGTSISRYEVIVFYSLNGKLSDDFPNGSTSITKSVCMIVLLSTDRQCFNIIMHMQHANRYLCSIPTDKMFETSLPKYQNVSWYAFIDVVWSTCAYFGWSVGTVLCVV